LRSVKKKGEDCSASEEKRRKRTSYVKRTNVPRARHWVNMSRGDYTCQSGKSNRRRVNQIQVKGLLEWASKKWEPS